MNSLAKNLSAARTEARRNQERLMAAIDGAESLDRLFGSDDLDDMYQDGLEYWRAKLGADQAAD
jgi:hypothetical protein